MRFKPSRAALVVAPGRRDSREHTVIPFSTGNVNETFRHAKVGRPRAICTTGTITVKQKRTRPSRRWPLPRPRKIIELIVLPTPSRHFPAATLLFPSARRALRDIEKSVTDVPRRGETATSSSSSPETNGEKSRALLLASSLRSYLKILLKYCYI